MHPNDETLKGPQIVFVLYKPHDGKDADLRQILAEHVPTLRRLEMATDRPTVLVKSKNGTYVEIFEWSTPESAGLAVLRTVATVRAPAIIFCDQRG